MPATIEEQIDALEHMTTGELIARFAELHGYPCHTRHRQYLIRKIAWRIQANAEGDLSERARRRAAELAIDAEIRVMAPRGAYRYYRCCRAIKSGASSCRGASLPALEIERVVIAEMQALAKDRDLMARVVTEAQASVTAEQDALTTEREGLRRELERHHRALREIAAKGVANAETAARMADLHGRIAEAERHLPVLDGRLTECDREAITAADAQAAFADFDQLWQNLSPREQARLLRLVVSLVEYDAESESISVTFRPNSIRALTNQRLEKAA